MRSLDRTLERESSCALKPGARFLGGVASADDARLQPREGGDWLASEPVAQSPTWEELAAANHEKDRVLAILSHELRTPLNVILGWAALLRRDGLNAEVRAQALRVIERTALSQASLLDRLLDASRLTARKIVLVLTRLDLGELARQCVADFVPLAVPAGITLVCDLGPGLWVRGDAGRLVQVLSNLLTNALKFSSAGGTVFVRGSLHAGAHGPEVRLSVVDHGRGIAPDSLRAIFECFHQDSRSNSSE